MTWVVAACLLAILLCLINLLRPAAHKPVAAMNIEQFICDAHELSVLLCERFKQQKIYLVGHSWGSVLGVLTVARYPELFHAYVGLGQVVNMREGERISYEWTLAQAEQANDAKSVAQLKAIGAPPYFRQHRRSGRIQRMLDPYAAAMS